MGWSACAGASAAPPRSPRPSSRTASTSPSRDGCSAAMPSRSWQASAGRTAKGRFALLHAFAMNVHNPSRWNDWFGRKKRIQQHQVWYERGCDRLELSWIGGNGKGQEYRLAIRTRCDYQAEARRACRKAGQELAPSEEVRIQVHVTQLWFDPNMNGSGRAAWNMSSIPVSDARTCALHPPQVSRTRQPPTRPASGACAARRSHACRPPPARSGRTTTCTTRASPSSSRSATRSRTSWSARIAASRSTSRAPTAASTSRASAC